MPETKGQQPGRHILVPIEGVAEVVTSAGTSKTQVSGELVVELLGDCGRPRGVRLVRFGLAAGSVDAERGPTGTITVLGDDSWGSVRTDGKGESLRLEIPGRLNYESLDRARVPDIDKGCYYRPAFEPCSTSIQLSLGDRRGTLVGQRGRVTMVCAAGDFEEIFSLSLDLADFEIRPIRANEGEVHFDANTPYDPCIGVNRRALTCQPVAFRDNPGDLNPSGSTIAAQFATAQTVWAKACMDIIVLPTVFIDDAALKVSSNLTAIRASYTDSNPNVIEVYFVSNLLPMIGGGSAGAIGVASCKVVMAEPNAGNPVLLAHELGHVLGLLHPPGSDPGTVMQPTGGANNPGTPWVTYSMTQNIANPVLATTMTACCLSHDKGDHYIKDFPVDVGLEPSDPLPAGMTRYSMSNIWNRRTNTAGSWSPVTGPQHESPYRFQNDGVTPATNYLFARVEQLKNFPVGNASVSFYLKTPGSGGGAANLNLVGSGAVPAGLAVGLSKDVTLMWSVPSGAPSHSCCFGVVESPAEPKGSQAVLDALSWAQFEDMSHQDNDWAQRNLDILDIAPNTGSGNTFESAPWTVQLPQSAKTGRQGLTLTVSAFGDNLAAAEVELLGKVFKVKPCEAVELKAPRPMVPGEESPVILRAVFDAPPRRGSSATILVDPTLGNTRLVGFGTTFRSAGERLALRMLLDRALAAAVDVADASDAEEWYELAAGLRQLLRNQPAHLKAVAAGIARLDMLKACVAGASRWPLAERYGIEAAGKRLLGDRAKDSPGARNSALASFLGRAHMAVRAV
ncbi:MAG TPA: hypothetical protein VEA60_10100 [Allosphingosinicella sp.]|nr:hypothetical protein [Allosphingosinicella sp.]